MKDILNCIGTYIKIEFENNKLFKILIYVYYNIIYNKLY